MADLEIVVITNIIVVMARVTPPPGFAGRDHLPPDDYNYRGGPPPSRRGSDYRSPSYGRRHHDNVDDFGRVRQQRSRSRSYERHAHDRARRSDDDSRSQSSYSSESSRSTMSRGSSSGSSSSSASSDDNDTATNNNEVSTFTKDQRTVFITQLVQRTNERDLRKFLKQSKFRVNDVILLRDRRTGRHKGCAYVELRDMDDVAKVCALSGQAPSFQRFPILIKASEAEKNYVAAAAATKSVSTAATPAQPHLPPLLNDQGKPIQAQKVYVGGLSQTVTHEHLHALFGPFGVLEKVVLQIDPTTAVSKGFAFLSFRDPKDANLAIQSMSGQSLAGRPMKTGWASQVVAVPGVEIVTSDAFPDDAAARTQQAYQVLAQLTQTAVTGQPIVLPLSQPATPSTQPIVVAAYRVPSVAEARASLQGVNTVVGSVVASQPVVVAAAAATAALNNNDDASKVRGVPTRSLLIHNMFDKDQETEEGWENDIKEEFEEECVKFGQIEKVVVMSKEAGGKIFASFSCVDAAQSCAQSLAGRWFDKRQLRVEFVSDESVP
jgi:RNA-binding protein 39